MNKINISLYHEINGLGNETIVLLPGMLATTKFWGPLTKKLESKYQVISVDTLGFGRSPVPKNIEYSKEDHASLLFQTLNQINLNSPFTLVGHSMGALLAVNFANRYPNLVKKLTLLAPPIFFSEKEARENISRHSSLPKILLYGLTAEIACFIFCFSLRGVTKLWLPLFLRNLPKDISQDTLLHTYYSYSKTLENIIEHQDIISEIKNLNVSVEIVYGLNDKRIIPENIKLLQNFNPRVKIHEYPELKHQFPLTNPEIITDLLKEP
jgi:cis-3-alkyl-4-acyloxetan-2-one decarboxylase